MLTETEVEQAFDRVSAVHNNVLLEFDRDDPETRIFAECLQFGLNPVLFADTIKQILDIHTSIPHEVIHATAPWAMQSVRHGICVGIEIGKLIATLSKVENSTGSDGGIEPGDS